MTVASLADAAFEKRRGEIVAAASVLSEYIMEGTKPFFGSPVDAADALDGQAFAISVVLGNHFDVDNGEQRVGNAHVSQAIASLQSLMTLARFFREGVTA